MDVYELNLSGYKGYVYYYYINGKLESGRYLINTISEDNCKQVYDKLCRSLKGKYGNPTDEYNEKQLKVSNPKFLAVADWCDFNGNLAIEINLKESEFAPQRRIINIIYQDPDYLLKKEKDLSNQL